MNPQNLIRMANNIARNFAAYPPEIATKRVRTHLSSFWDSRMLHDLHDYIERGGSDVHPMVKAALELRSVN